MFLTSSPPISLKQRKEHAGNISLLFWTLFFGGLFMLMPEMAMASDPIGSSICKIVSGFQGTTAKGIATLGVIVLGFGALFGKISWGMAIMVTVGIILIFGVTAILGYIYEGGSGCA